MFVTHSKNLVIGLLSLMFAFPRLYLPAATMADMKADMTADMKADTKSDMVTPVYTQVVFQKLKK